MGLIRQKNIFALLILFCFLSSKAQQNEPINKRTATDIFLSQPNFSSYKDNYFITGTSLKGTPTVDNSDVKFQISLKYRLSKKPVFDNIYAFIMYTQKSFWDIYKKSSPFGDINFNPGLGLIRPYSTMNGRLGYYSVMIEHESNGKDSILSRSWNYFSFNWGAQLNKKLLIEARAVIPYGSTSDNPELFNYIGYGDIGLTYIFKPQRFYAKLILKKGSKWDWRGSVETQAFVRPSENANLYLMLQGFHGYCENLLDYNKRVSMMRFGIVIKPNFMNFF